MLDALKDLIASFTIDRENRADQAFDDCRLAAAALLFHVADLDGVILREETVKLRSLISERFGLDAAQTSRLISEAQIVDREAIDLFQFTNALNRTLDHEGRLKVIEMMWEMAYADGKTDELEETTIWRVCELMGVSTRERVELRKKVASQKSSSPLNDSGEEFVSPWEK